MGAGVTQQARISAARLARRRWRVQTTTFFMFAIMAWVNSPRRPLLRACETESASGAAQELGDDLAGLLTALVGDAL